MDQIISSNPGTWPFPAPVLNHKYLVWMSWGNLRIIRIEDSPEGLKLLKAQIKSHIEKFYEAKGFSKLKFKNLESLAIWVMKEYGDVESFEKFEFVKIEDIE